VHDPEKRTPVFRKDHAPSKGWGPKGLQREEHIMSETNLRDELRNATVEPLLPIEKKLIAWSLSLGLALLVVLAAINHFFPVTL